MQLPPTVERGLCANCIQRPPHFDQCTALFHYNFPLREVIGDLKFQGKIWYSLPLGELLAVKVNEMYSQHKPDCILVPPMHPSKLRQRGFNQAQEIARVLSRRTKIALARKTLKKIKETGAQSELAAKERASNLRGCFKVEGSMHGKHVLLVDDVVTTGHTVNEISRVLKIAGAARVDVVSVARTPPPDV